MWNRKCWFSVRPVVAVRCKQWRGMEWRPMLSVSPSAAPARRNIRSNAEPQNKPHGEGRTTRQHKGKLDVHRSV